MNNIFRYLLFSFLSIISISALAQDVNVSGTVINNNGEPLKGATVFIGGSERVMPTDENGRFNFAHVPPGNFQLSAQMIGYAPLTHNIIVKNIPVTVEMKMQVKSITLEQVTIGGKGAREKNIKLFKEKFLGKSANAKQCELLNPEVINFSTRKGELLADADDFLIIENKRLGYRIHYLLKGFDFNHINKTVLYHGECSFEELDGSDKQKKKWVKNRLATYKGSFMHFLRSVYANNTVENGFITRPAFGFATIKYDTATLILPDRPIIIDRQVAFDSLVTAIDTNFISFASGKQLYVVYDPKNAAHFVSNKSDEKESAVRDPKGSVLKLLNLRSIIDRRGNYTNYRDFLVQGYWADARVGDQLPVEYKPPIPDIPHRNVHANPILASLQKWADSIPQEKAYLHMDKPYYVPGDTIWFKGYLTSGSRHQLSALSGAAYVELINDQNQLIKNLKLPVNSGTIAGNLILGEDVKAGSYRIRAYTQWMRNAGQDYFFDRTFTVGDPTTFKDKTVKTVSLQSTDIQFFPESGALVNGLTSRVAFKAVAPDGLGTPVSGTVTDNDNIPVAELTSLYAGMGSFLLRPQNGKTYTAHIKFIDGTTKAISLPAALNAGYVLSIYQTNKDSVLVRIQASAALQHTTVNLVVHSSGEVVFSSPVNINGAMVSIWLDKKTFPSGIAQFTIFNKNNEPLNERIAFIKSADKMHLAVKTPKATYQGKEHVTLQLNAKESEGTPVAANFSVAVIDEDKAPVDEDAESTIFSNILLTSDIKGYVEKPNYYFNTDTNGTVNRALDNLMLTQGYRRFEWKQILSDTLSAKPEFAAEGLSTNISGTVTDLAHHLMPNATVLLVSINARINRVTTTDTNGRFTFDKLVFPDSARFAIQARTRENSDHAILLLDSIPKITINIKQNVADIILFKKYLQKVEDEGVPLKLNGTHLLKQVNIKDLKINYRNGARPQGMFTLPDEESADHIYTITDPDSYINLKMFIRERVAGMVIKGSENGGAEGLYDIRPPTNFANKGEMPDNTIAIMLDGNPSNLDEIENIDPADVAEIQIVRTNQAMINFLRAGPTHPAGFLLVLTKPYNTRKHTYLNISNISPKGFNSVRQFYSPRYDHPADNTKPDLRTTIYWNPYVNTDTTGNATLDFYNADGPGNYRVVIEGINAAGELGRQVYHYKVE